MKQNNNPDKHNRWYRVIFATGFVLNLAAGVVTSIGGFASITGQTRINCGIASEVFLLPLFLSCVFLWDAFRRFRKTKDENQTINNRQIGILSVAFGAFAFGLLA